MGGDVHYPSSPDSPVNGDGGKSSLPTPASPMPPPTPMDAIEEAEAAAEDAESIALCIEGLSAELRALRPALVAAEARADACEARATAATERCEAAAADVEAVRCVVLEVIHADEATCKSTGLADGLSAAEAVRLALNVVANDKGAVAAARRAAAAAASERGSLRADLEATREVAAALREETEEARAESIRAIRMADEWREAAMDAQAKVREHLTAMDAAARDAAEARRDLATARQECEDAEARAAAAEAALAESSAAIVAEAERDQLDARIIADAADVHQMRRALVDVRAALSAATTRCFEAETAAAAAEERAAIAVERAEAAESRASSRDRAVDEAFHLRGNLREVVAERETLAHAVDLARSGAASLSMERDAAVAEVKRLDAELTQSRDTAERLMGEKQAMQAMLAGAAMELRGRDTLSIDDLMGVKAGSDAPSADVEGRQNEDIFRELDAFTAKLQRKREAMEMTIGKEEGDADDGCEKENENGMLM